MRRQHDYVVDCLVTLCFPELLETYRVVVRFEANILHEMVGGSLHVAMLCCLDSWTISVYCLYRYVNRGNPSQ